MMMNNEFVYQQASRWAAKAIPETADPAERVRRMYLAAFARPATQDEIDHVLAFAGKQGTRSESEVWADVAHVLLNSAEFIYVQ
jgi:hypothetical protein